MMREREEPRFVKFAKGECVDGVLVEVERISVRDQESGRTGAAVRYTVKQDDGTFVCFLGTHQINTKLRPTDKGYYISVRYEGEDANVGRGGNQMKHFKVLVSDQTASVDSLYINDSDIPF
jgi:hypothetical protein